MSAVVAKYVALYDMSDAVGICLMIIGILMIPFSIIISWKNEMRCIA